MINDILFNIMPDIPAFCSHLCGFFRSTRPACFIIRRGAISRWATRHAASQISAAVAAITRIRLKRRPAIWTIGALPRWNTGRLLLHMTGVWREMLRISQRCRSIVLPGKNQRPCDQIMQSLSPLGKERHDVADQEPSTEDRLHREPDCSASQ
jgi:hypothetical protein